MLIFEAAPERIFCEKFGIYFELYTLRMGDFELLAPPRKFAVFDSLDTVAVGFLPWNISSPAGGGNSLNCPSNVNCSVLLKLGRFLAK